MAATRAKKRPAGNVTDADDRDAPANKRQASTRNATDDATTDSANESKDCSTTVTRRSGRASAKAKLDSAAVNTADSSNSGAAKKGKDGTKTKSSSTNKADPAAQTDTAPSKKTTKKSTASSGGKKGSTKDTNVKVEAEENKADKDLDSKTQDLSLSNIVVPVDEYCSLRTHKVLIDRENNVIYDAALNQTNSGNNNNKFYKIQLLTNNRGDYKTWTRWGRVGELGQNALLGDGSFDDALKQFDKKFKDKTGLKWDDRAGNPKPNKYVYVERSYEPDSDDDAREQDTKKSEEPQTSQDDGDEKLALECTLPTQVKSLMELIFNQEHMQSTMADLNYDANKLPLGKLSKQTVSRGYEALKSLSEIIDDPKLAASSGNGETFNQAVERLSNLYYSYIPHAFGRNRPPIIMDNARLRKEIELLDSLTDMKLADSLLKAEKASADTVHILDSRFKGLNLNEMSPLEHKSQEFTNISDYLTESRGATHGVNYEVLDVFRIERPGESERFAGFNKKNSHRRLLWHGSRSTNFGGILSQGLRIAPPEAPVSGYMFGKGIYLADMSSKSANYCCSYISGGHALLLLCEAELGDPMYELTHSSYTAGEDAVKQGSYATWGQGRTGPTAWKDAKCIHPDLAGVQMPDTTIAPGDTNVAGATLFYNEYICYDVAQVRLRYLLRVKM